MRKITKYALLFAAALLTTAGLSSCSDDNNDNGETAGLTNAQKEMKAVSEQYVSNTVNSTYKYLAEETANLYTLLDNDLTKFRAGTLTQSDIDQTCETFKKHALTTRAARLSSSVPPLTSVSTRTSTHGRST